MLHIRPSSPEYLETVIMSENMDLRALSRTDSDSAVPASAVIFSTAQGDVLDHHADRLIEYPAPTRLDGRADPGLLRPPVNRRCRHGVVSRPFAGPDASRNCKCELKFLGFAILSAHDRK